jgi:hypothetical protein
VLACVCLALPCHALLCCTVLCCAVPHGMPCRAVPHHALLCYAVLCHAMPCCASCAMLCRPGCVQGQCNHTCQLTANKPYPEDCIRHAIPVGSVGPAHSIARQQKTPLSSADGFCRCMSCTSHKTDMLFYCDSGRTILLILAIQRPVPCINHHPPLVLASSGACITCLPMYANIMLQHHSLACHMRHMTSPYQ